MRKWDIRNEGRAWQGDEAWERFELTPEKIEMIDGRILWCDKDRENLLGLLLENVGARKTAVGSRFGGWPAGGSGRPAW